MVQHAKRPYIQHASKDFKAIPGPIEREQLLSQHFVHVRPTWASGFVGGLDMEKNTICGGRSNWGRIAGIEGAWRCKAVGKMNLDPNIFSKYSQTSHQNGKLQDVFLNGLHFVEGVYQPLSKVKDGHLACLLPWGCVILTMSGAVWVNHQVPTRVGNCVENMELRYWDLHRFRMEVS